MCDHAGQRQRKNLSLKSMRYHGVMMETYFSLPRALVAFIFSGLWFQALWYINSYLLQFFATNSIFNKQLLCQVPYA